MSEKQSADAILDISLTSQTYVSGWFKGWKPGAFKLWFKLNSTCTAPTEVSQAVLRTRPAAAHTVVQAVVVALLRDAPSFHLYAHRAVEA
jgi:hypothetical protein